jgi:hypothetical protein
MGTMEITDHTLATFFDAYVAAALTTSNDNSDESGGIPLDSAEYEGYTLDESAERKMLADCTKFLEDNSARLYEWQILTGQKPHDWGFDFWLDQNGHGAGFRDRSYGYGERADVIGRELSELAGAYPERYMGVDKGSTEIYCD